MLSVTVNDFRLTQSPHDGDDGNQLLLVLDLVVHGCCLIDGVEGQSLCAMRSLGLNHLGLYCYCDGHWNGGKII